MDKSATIIMLGLVVIITLPFLIIYMIKKSKDIKFLSQFTNLAQKEKIVISQKEFWNHSYAIGIDNNSKKIIYAHRLKDETTETIIDLADIEKCRIVTINKAIKNQNGKNPRTDRLELVLTYRNPAIPEKVLNFYENAEFMPNAEECSHIENWDRIINSTLKKGNL